jgi:hypothetical protein
MPLSERPQVQEVLRPTALRDPQIQDQEKAMSHTPKTELTSNAPKSTPGGGHVWIASTTIMDECKHCGTHVYAHNSSKKEDEQCPKRSESTNIGHPDCPDPSITALTVKLSERIQQATKADLIDDFGWASDAAAMEDQIAAVKAALREYHHGVDTHGEHIQAGQRLATRVETALNTPYVPGATMPKLDAFRRQWTGSDGDSSTTATETGAES